MIKLMEDPFRDAREKMVEEQLILRGIKNSLVLKAFSNVPRECFVTEENIERAYEDHPLPTILGQTISQPYMMALMTELLELPPEGGAKILEIGTGSGYQAAILAYMGNDVVSVEKLPELAKFAEKNLTGFNFGGKIKICVGDGCDGAPEDAPFDGVVVTAASPKIPPAIMKQCKIGGRIVIPVGNLFFQELIVAVKKNDEDFDIIKSIGCRFVPLIGKDGFSV
mgnify:CR=1 FL=1